MLLCLGVLDSMRKTWQARAHLANMLRLGQMAALKTAGTYYHNSVVDQQLTEERLDHDIASCQDKATSSLGSC